MGVTIRHWFNTRHARKGKPTWTWLATAIILIVIAWLSTAPEVLSGGAGEKAAAPAFGAFAGDPHFARVAETIRTRCSMCHAQEPVWEGIARPPRGVLLETDAEIAAHAEPIYIAGRKIGRHAAGQRHPHHPPGARRSSSPGTAAP